MSDISMKRKHGLDESEIQGRIGGLYHAQLQSLMQRAQEYRPLPDYEPPNS